MTGRPRLMLRWSWRDLRRRWGMVLVTALIIAIGTGTYAGFGGTSAWRLESQDASYAALHYHDLQVTLPENTDVAEGSLAKAIGSIPDADQVAALEEQLTARTQVDASQGGDTILVPGELVSASPEATVDALHLASGRFPQAGNDAGGDDEVVLEAKFVQNRNLADTGQITISGDRKLRYVGTGYTPQHFYVLGDGTSIAGAYGYAIVYAPLETVQALSGRKGRVTGAALRLAEGADAKAVGAQITKALADVGAKVEGPADDAGRRAMYADARNDEKTWTALSLLILLGASFAAFNLVNRMVEAERHEIGVAMALGTPIRRLSLRPLLVGIQIALAGVIVGIGVGMLAGALMRNLLTTLLPLPVWLTPFPVGRYAQAAALGVLLPMLATVIPVWRALRVEPVDALRSQAAGSTRAAGMAPVLRRLRLRGHVVAMMPLRNVLRSPRRTILTALGIGASITALVAVLGLLDSFDATFARSDAEVAGASADRLEVTLSGFTVAQDPNVGAIVGSPVVARAEPGLRVSGIMRAHGDEVETIIDVIDFADAMWVPSTVQGSLPAGKPGLVISEKAASDLGVRAGDTVTLRHPVREGTSYRLVDSKVPIAAIHPNPMRFFTYVDSSQAGPLFDLDGIVSTVAVQPAPGHTADEVKRDLFARDGVASVQEVAVLGDLLSERLGQFTGILRAMEAFTLALALLIALNSATLTMEERRREQATMFAYGLPVRTVLRTIVLEIAITAFIGTLIGLVGGLAALHWLITMFTTETFPELGVVTSLSAGSIVTVIVLGVGVAAAAPLLAVRRLLRTDIPSTLRVLE